MYHSGYLWFGKREQWVLCVNTTKQKLEVKKMNTNTKTKTMSMLLAFLLALSAASAVSGDDLTLWTPTMVVQTGMAMVLPTLKNKPKAQT